jgi:putative membrane protein
LDKALQESSPQLVAQLVAIKGSSGCMNDPNCSAAFNKLWGMFVSPGDLSSQLQQLAAGLTTLQERGKAMPEGIDQMLSHISTGVDPTTCAAHPAGCGAREALLAVSGGLPQLIGALSDSVSGTLLASIGTGGKGCDPTATLLCGANSLVDGSDQLASGAGALADGVGQLAAGGRKLSDGSHALDDGLGQLAGGARMLADGLGDAADGAGQIDDGLGQASQSAPALVDGAHQLSAKGSRKLAQRGQETAQRYGEMYAELVAGAKRADTDGMALGAPAGATGLTAYDFVILGEDGHSGRDLGRGLAAVVVLGLGAGGLVVRRRLFA